MRKSDFKEGHVYVYDNEASEQYAIFLCIKEGFDSSSVTALTLKCRNMPEAYTKGRVYTIDRGSAMSRYSTPVS